MDEQRLLAGVEEGVELKRRFFAKEASRVLEAGKILARALREGGKVLVFGNGGSAADAQHFTAELVNRYRVDRPALAAIALTTDTSILTSVANDSDYRFVFSRQIEALGRAGDVALAISTSGNSENVLEAVEAARREGLVTIGISGRDGGELAPRVDLCLTVGHAETPRIQEVHIVILHLLCQVVEEELFSKDRAHA